MNYTLKLILFIIVYFKSKHLDFGHTFFDMGVWVQASLLYYLSTYCYCHSFVFPVGRGCHLMKPEYHDSSIAVKIQKATLLNSARILYNF